MRKFLYVMLLVVAGLAPAFFARPAAAAEMTWTMSTDKPYRIDLEFFSRDGEHVWPGHGEIYVLPGRSARTYTLACRAGASICYGAWPHDSDIRKHWGVGRSIGNPCDNCCYTCGRQNPNRELVN